MVAAPFWDDAPDPWDVLIIGEHTLPGITTVSGEIGRKVDVRSPPGGDGARVRDRGYEPATIEVENQCWRADQLRDLQPILEALNPRRVDATGAAVAADQRLTATQRELSELIQLSVLDSQQFANDREARDRLVRVRARAIEEQQRQAQRSRQQARPARTPYDVVHPALSMVGIRSAYVTVVGIPKLERGVLKTRLKLVEWTAVPRPAPRPTAPVSGGLEGTDTAFDQYRRGLRPTATPPARAR